MSTLQSMVAEQSSLIIPVPGLPFKLDFLMLDPTCGAFHILLKHWKSFKNLKELVSKDQEEILRVLKQQYEEISALKITINQQEAINQITLTEELSRKINIFEDEIKKHLGDLKYLIKHLLRNISSILCDSNRTIFLSDQKCHGEKIAIYWNVDDGHFLKVVIRNEPNSENQEFASRRVITAFVTRKKRLVHLFCCPKYWFNFTTLKSKKITDRLNFLDGNVYFDLFENSKQDNGLAGTSDRSIKACRKLGFDIPEYLDDIFEIDISQEPESPSRRRRSTSSSSEQQTKRTRMSSESSTDSPDISTDCATITPARPGLALRAKNI